MNNCKRKVLVFTLGFIGGAERMAITIAKLLPKDRFYVKFIILGKEKDIMDFMPSDFEVDYLPFSTKSPLSIIRIWHKILKEKPDVVFGTQGRINPHTIIAARLAGRKVIVRSSGMIGAYKGFMYIANIFSLRFANMIIAQQEQMRLQIIEKCHTNPDKIVTIHNILDIDNIELKIHEQSPFSTANDINYVNVARIAYGKGQDLLIKAFSIVKHTIPTAQLYLIGPPNDKQREYRQALIDLVRILNISDCVHFVGYDSNPYRWVKHCDCFVFPSRNEGLPNALIEASYIGVPCVATKCLDIISDIIKDGYNGYTTDVDNVKGIANGMISAIHLSDFKMVYQPSKKEDYIRTFEII